MDEEVKKRRKEREQQALEQRKAEERKRILEEQSRHLLANLISQNPIHNQSLSQSLNQNPLQIQRTQSISQITLQRAQAQQLLSLQRNPNQTQQRTQTNRPGNTTATPTTNQGPLPSMASLSSRFARFSSQPFLSSFPHLKNPSLSLPQTALSAPTSSKNPLDEILDLTVNSPSISPDSTEAGLRLDSLTGRSGAFRDDFILESLISRSALNAQHTAQIQQPPPLLLQQQQHLQARQQQENPNLLVNNHQPDFLDLFDLAALSYPLSTQRANHSSSASSSSSTSSTPSVSNNPVSRVLSTSPLLPTSSSSSLFSSAPSNSLFSSPCLLPPSDSLSLPNGHCSSDTLDAREALNTMLQSGLDRKSVIQYLQPE